jgi:copper chaperone CopZ
VRLFFPCFIAAFVLVSAVAGQVDGGRYKLEGVCLCCKTCEKTVEDLLAKVHGVSDVRCDHVAKTVTFKAKNEKAGDDGVSALVNAGFYFKVSVGDKAYEISSKPSGIKGEQIVLRNVHACCEDCEKSIQGLFKSATVKFDGKDDVKILTVTGKNLDADAVLKTLHTAGLHGVIDENKK